MFAKALPKSGGFLGATLVFSAFGAIAVKSCRTTVE
jgi:hypothetical protein